MCFSEKPLIYSKFWKELQISNFALGGCGSDALRSFLAFLPSPRVTSPVHWPWDWPGTGLTNGTMATAMLETVQGLAWAMMSLLHPAMTPAAVGLCLAQPAGWWDPPPVTAYSVAQTAMQGASQSPAHCSQLEADMSAQARGARPGFAQQSPQWTSWPGSNGKWLHFCF
jgi:hypothetical protein